MKYKLSDILWAVVPVLIVACVAVWAITRPFIGINGLPEWGIVKQRTNETYHLNNYGYVDGFGNVIAGFTNINQARAEMKKEKWYWYHKTLPEAKKEQGPWEIAK